MLQPGSRLRVTLALVAAGHRSDLPDPDQYAAVCSQSGWHNRIYGGDP